VKYNIMQASEVNEELWTHVYNYRSFKAACRVERCSWYAA
jgi:hypothetical protein